ncbi:MAG: hypothetical protein ACD_28C00121G0003, partial [uncultured bacterium]
LGGDFQLFWDTTHFRTPGLKIPDAGDIHVRLQNYTN